MPSPITQLTKLVSINRLDRPSAPRSEKLSFSFLGLPDLNSKRKSPDYKISCSIGRVSGRTFLQAQDIWRDQTAT